mmetsp:Transcript_60588/g.112421  ORF Transcript_60588/g.112421 Transcript_60588/m.112421 type:complete len:110 (-) Transcript_60588:294-623(-)
MSRETESSVADDVSDDEQVADDHIQELADAVKDAAERRIGVQYDEWEVVHFSTKEAKGTLYFIYVSAGKEGGVLLTVCEDGRHGPVRLESAVESRLPGGPCATSDCTIL